MFHIKIVTQYGCKKNIYQQKRKTNKSGYNGVNWKEKNNAWTAQISVNYKKIYLGLYSTPIEAAIARNLYINVNNLPHKTNKISI